jgi:dTMP kinase
MSYQGYGMGVDLDSIDALVRLIELKPNLTLILEVPEFIAKQRLAARGGAADRYELMGSETMARIAAGFRAIAAAEPQRCVLVDARADADTVFERIMAILAERLNLP